MEFDETQAYARTFSKQARTMLLTLGEPASFMVIISSFLGCSYTLSVGAAKRRAAKKRPAKSHRRACERNGAAVAVDEILPPSIR